MVERKNYRVGLGGRHSSIVQHVFDCVNIISILAISICIVHLISYNHISMNKNIKNIKLKIIKRDCVRIDMRVV